MGEVAEVGQARSEQGKQGLDLWQKTAEGLAKGEEVLLEPTEANRLVLEAVVDGATRTRPVIEEIWVRRINNPKDGDRALRMAGRAEVSSRVLKTTMGEIETDWVFRTDMDGRLVVTADRFKPTEDLAAAPLRPKRQRELLAGVNAEIDKRLLAMLPDGGKGKTIIKNISSIGLVMELVDGETGHEPAVRVSPWEEMAETMTEKGVVTLGPTDAGKLVLEVLAREIMGEPVIVESEKCKAGMGRRVDTRSVNGRSVIQFQTKAELSREIRSAGSGTLNLDFEMGVDDGRLRISSKEFETEGALEMPMEVLGKTETGPGSSTKDRLEAGKRLVLAGLDGRFNDLLATELLKRGMTAPIIAKYMGQDGLVVKVDEGGKIRAGEKLEGEKLKLFLQRVWGGEEIAVLTAEPERGIEIRTQDGQTFRITGSHDSTVAMVNRIVGKTSGEAYDRELTEKLVNTAADELGIRPDQVVFKPETVENDRPAWVARMTVGVRTIL